MALTRYLLFSVSGNSGHSRLYFFIRIIGTDMKYPILLASLLALSLAACGKKEETAEAPAPAPEVVAPAEKKFRR